MTVQRLGQLTAELQTLADVAPYGGGALLPAISNTKARTGVYSYRHSGNNPPFGFSFPRRDAIRCGFWLNHNGATTSGSARPILLSLVVGMSLVRVDWDHVGGLLRLYTGYAYNSSNLNLALSAPAGIFSQVDTWRHIGLTYKCDVADGFCSLYMDGVRVFGYTGNTLTYPSGGLYESGGIYGVYLLGGSTSGQWVNYAYADDFYVDSFEGEDDSAPSSRRFLFGRVNGAGIGAAQWSAVGDATTWQCADEAVPDGDTTYAKALTAGKQDQYAAADVTVPADHLVRAVIPIAVARKTDAALDSKLKLGLAVSGAARLGEAQGLPTAYGVKWDRFTTQADGTAWTEAAANAQQVAIESAGAF